MVFVDEFSAKAKPYGGKSYSKVKSPDIVPKDYEVKGEIQIIGALKAHNPEVITHFSDTKRHTDVIELFKKLRQKYAQKTIYVVLDNARAHIAQGLKDYLKKIGNTIKLVYLPTYSPWLNPIEAVWGVMKKAVLHNSDFPSIQELIDAITKYFEYKNKKIEQAV